MARKIHAARRRRCQRRFALAALLAVVGSTRSAAARDQIQGVFEGAVGYTDNVFSSPDEPVPDVPRKQGDVLMMASPSVVYAYATSRATHRLTYGVTGNFFLTHGSANSFANRAEWRGFFPLSPRFDLVLGAGANQDQQHTSNTYFGSAATTVRSLLPGTDTFLLLRADETLGIDLGPGWRASQSMGGAMNTPLFVDSETRTYQWSNRAGVERQWREDAVGPELRADYTRITNAVAPDGTPIGDQSLWVLGGVGRWRHDWGRYFTSRAEGGALYLRLVERDAHTVHPTWAAAIGYTPRSGDAELLYDHTVTTNLYLAQTLLVDEVTLRGLIPLDRHEKFWIGASAGYQHGRLLEPNGDLATPVNVLLGDVGALWEVHDQLQISARYQYVNQDSDADLPPLPLSFVRNTFMAGIRVTLPRDEDVPRTYRPPRRVGREDEIRNEFRESVEQVDTDASDMQR